MRNLLGGRRGVEGRRSSSCARSSPGPAAAQLRRRGGPAGRRAAVGGRAGAGAPRLSRRRQRAGARARPGAGPRGRTGGDGAGTRSGRRAALALRASRSAAAVASSRPSIRNGSRRWTRSRSSRAWSRWRVAVFDCGRDASLKLGAPMILATTPPFEPLRCVSTLPDVHQNVARAGSTARAFVQAAREELRQRHDGGAGGLAVVAAYTDAIDHLVEWLFDNATAHYQARNPAAEPALHPGGAGRVRTRASSTSSRTSTCSSSIRGR